MSSFYYISDEFKIYGGVPCTVKAMGEHDEDQESYEGRYDTSLTLKIGENQDNLLQLNMSIIDNDRGNGTSLMGFDFEGPHKSYIDYMQHMQDPSNLKAPMDQVFGFQLQNLSTAYRELTRTNHENPINSFGATVIMNSTRKYRLTDDDADATLLTSTSLNLRNIQELQDIPKRLPLTRVTEKNGMPQFSSPLAGIKMNKVEEGMIHLATWAQSSLMIQGSALFDGPMLDMLKDQSNIPTLQKGLGVLFKTMPTGSERHKKFVQSYYRDNCS